jgi:hypothetical protein
MHRFRIELFFMFLLTVTLIVAAHVAFASVGEIGKVKGSGAIERGADSLDAVDGLGIQMRDTAVTANANMRIDFVDDTRVDITEHSRLIIDEFVYDPANDIGKLSIKASLGTVRYASGQIAKNFKQNVKIRTPSATIAVRGTDFIMVVDEMGGSMITLLPSCDTTGACYTGEIEVETDAGFVVLNQAFQATMTSHSMQRPSPPLLLDLDEQQISQLLILRKRNPYLEEEFEEYMRKKRMADFLGIDFLEFDGLDGDALTDSIENIWATALDETDYMLADMLYDMLDQLNAMLMALFMDELSRQNKAFLKEEGNVYGFDPATGIRLENEDPNWVWSRQDFEFGNNIELRLHQSYGYTLNIQQGEFELYDYKLGADGSNSIDITQSAN